MICKTHNCNTRISPYGCSAREHGGVCLKCRGGKPQETVQVALDKPPSIRNKAEWEALRDKYSGHIKCMLAQGESIKAYQTLYEQAVDALAQLPVQICPHELRRLQLIEQDARELVGTLMLCGVPPKPLNGERSMPYLNRMFRGMSFRGCFRGRH